MSKPDHDFDVAFFELMRDEGGATITDDPDDPGGRTKYGLSQRFLTAIGHTQKKVDDITEQDAEHIYRLCFWDEYNISGIATLHSALARKVFNFCVNAGPDPAFRCLQRAMRACGVRVKEDGVMGPITRVALDRYLVCPDNRVQTACILVAYRCECAGYYRDLDKPKYEAGWVERAYRQ